MERNSNLIVIVPREDDKTVNPVVEKPATSSVATANGGTKASVQCAQKTPASYSEDEEKPAAADPKPNSAEQKPVPKKEESSPVKPNKVPAKFKRESNDDELVLTFDEDELDFESEAPEVLAQDDDEVVLHVDESDTLTLDVDESEALALHDEDEDSLEKLMDEMEMEFSGKPTVEVEPIKSSTESTKKDPPKSKVGTKKKSPPPKDIALTKKTTAVMEKASVKEKPVLKEKDVVTQSNEPPITAAKKSSPPTRRSRTPILLRRFSRSPPPYSKGRSPVGRRSRSPSYRRSSRSPRRSPLRSPPHLRRLSRSPLPRRSRSPVPLRRSKSPYRRAVSPYPRSKSPIRRWTPPRRLSPLPRRSPRRSPLLPPRRSRTRSRSLPRREFRSRSPLPPRSRSPLPLRRRSRSPSFIRRSLSGDRRRPVARRSNSPRRRSPTPPLRGRRRTPPPRRSPPPTRPIRRRSSSPSRRPTAHRSPPRRLLERRPLKPTDPEPRTVKSTTRPRTPNEIRESRVESDGRKEPHGRPRSDEETDRRRADSGEGSDPKLEARRKKFESNAPVAGTQKKLYLKMLADELKGKGSDEEVPSSSHIKGRLQIEPAVGRETRIDESASGSPPPKPASKSQPTSPFNRIGRSTQVEDRSQQTRSIPIPTKESQPKLLPTLRKEEDELDARKLKPSAIRYTVADAKEEIELMKLKRKRKTEQILEEEGENREIVGLKKKKKKKDKDKKRDKKKELAAAVSEGAEVKDKSVTRSNVGAVTSGRSDGTDLRAELSRRRAQRLQGQPGSRLIQSALEGVVADKKSKPLRLNSPPSESNAADDTSKGKGRRVHVVTHAHKKKFTEEVATSDSEGANSEDESQKNKRVPSGILRGTMLHRRSQVNLQSFAFFIIKTCSHTIQFLYRHTVIGIT